MQRIGVFGAAFNPPTLGHRDVLAQASEHFDEILLVPSVSHAFGKQLIPLKDRLNMLKRFIEDLPFKSKITLSHIEEDLLAKQKEKGPIYTYDVLSALTEQYALQHKKVKLGFIIGPDNSKEEIWKKFYRYQDIEKQWPLFVAKENIPIHSTLAREICATYAQENPLRLHKLIDLVGEKIAHYIEQHKLYRNDKTSSDFNVSISVDVVIFSLVNEQLSVLVTQRQEQPFQGDWSLSLGEIKTDCDTNLEEAAKRNIKSLLGLETPYLEQVQTIGSNTRDPRHWSVSVVYYSLVHAPSAVTALNMKWMTIHEALSKKLAFDHQHIIENCLHRLQNKSLYTSLPIFLMPEEFTLTDLQKTYELVLGIKMEKKSFRRRLLDAGFLQETGHSRHANHRPALLYRLAQRQPYYFARIIEGVRDSKNID